MSSDDQKIPDREFRARNSARTKRQILDAAGRLFARFGFSHVSLKAIASEVGITPAMINHHFGSKRHLFEAVASDEWGWNDDGSEEDLGDVRGVARSTVEYWCDLDARSPSLALLRSLDQPATSDLFSSELERRVTDPWRRELTGTNVDLRARIVVGLMMGIGLFTTDALVNPDAPPLSDHDRDVLVDYLERMLEIMRED